MIGTTWPLRRSRLDGRRGAIVPGHLALKLREWTDSIQSTSSIRKPRCPPKGMEYEGFGDKDKDEDILLNYTD